MDRQSAARSASLSRGLAVFHQFHWRGRGQNNEDSRQEDRRKHDHGVRVREARRSRSADSFPARRQAEGAVGTGIALPTSADSVPRQVALDHGALSSGETNEKELSQLKSQVAALRQELRIDGEGVPISTTTAAHSAAATDTLPLRHSGGRGIEGSDAQSVERAQADAATAERSAAELAAANQQITRLTEIAEQYLETGRAWQTYATTQREVAERYESERAQLEEALQEYANRSDDLERQLALAQAAVEVANARCEELQLAQPATKAADEPLNRSDGENGEGQQDANAASELERLNAELRTLRATEAALWNENEQLKKECATVRQQRRADAEHAAAEQRKISATRDKLTTQLVEEKQKAAELEQRLSQLQRATTKDKSASEEEEEEAAEHVRLLEAKHAELEDENRRLASQCASLRHQLTDAERRTGDHIRDAANRSLQTSSLDIAGEEVDNRVEEMQRQIDRLKSERAILSSALESKSALLQDADDSLMSDEASHSLLREQLGAQASRLEAIEKHSVQLRERNDRLTKESAALLSELADVQGRCEVKDLAIRRLEGDAAGLRTQLTSAMHDVAKLSSLCTERETDLADLQKSNTTLSTTIKRQQEGIDELQTALTIGQFENDITQEWTDARERELLRELVFPFVQLALQEDASAAQERSAQNAKTRSLEADVLWYQASSEKDQLHWRETAVVRDQLLDLLNDLSGAFEGLRATKDLQLLALEEECHRQLVGQRAASEMLELSLLTTQILSSGLEDSRLRTLEAENRILELETQFDEINGEHQGLFENLSRRLQEAEEQRDRAMSDNTELQENLENVLKEEEINHLEYERTAQALKRELEESRTAAQSTLHDKSSVISDLSGKLRGANAEVSRLDGEVQRLSALCSQKEEAHKQLEDDLFRANEELGAERTRAGNVSLELEAAQNSVTQLLAEGTTLQQQHEALVSLETDLRGANSTLKQKLLAAESECREASKTIAALRAEKAAVSDGAATKSAEFTKLKAELADARAQLERTAASLREGVRNREDLSTELKEAVAATQSLRETNCVLEEECRDAKAKLESQARDLKRKAAELENATKERGQIHAQLQHMTDESAARTRRMEEECASKSAQLAESSQKQKALQNTIAILELKARQHVQQIDELQSLQNETFTTARTAEESFRDTSEKLTVAENRIRQLASRSDEKSKTLEKEVLDAAARMSEEKKAELLALEKMLLSERNNATDAREAQRSALTFVSQLQKENGALTEKVARLSQDASTMSRELHERKREGAVLASLAEDCSAQLGSAIVLPPVDLIHELMNRVTLQFSSAEHTFLDQIQFDELIGILERHSAVGSSLGIAVHRVFASLRRAADVLVRAKPRKEDAAAVNFFRTRKAAVASLEQQNVAVDKCLRRATEFNVKLRAEAEKLRQHLHAIGTALSAPMRPTARVLDSITQHKAYISAQVQVLHEKSARQLFTLKAIRDAYSRFEDEFSRTGCGGVFLTGGGLSGTTTRAPPDVPTLVDSLDQKAALFAEGEEFCRQPLVISINDFSAELVHGGGTLLAVERPTGGRASGDHATASASSRLDPDDDEALRFVEQLPEDDADNSEEEDELATSDLPSPSIDFRSLYVKVQKEKMRLYRLVRSLTKRLKSESLKVPASPASPQAPVGRENDVPSPEPSAIVAADASPVGRGNLSGQNTSNEVIWVPQQYFPEAAKGSPRQV